MSGDIAKVEAQTAFVGLLTRPVVTSESGPDLHRLARRHQRTLAGWAARCGYRLVMLGEATRLHRPSVGGEVAHPDVATPPSRRQLVLTLAAAAACEEGESTTTVQTISDGVRVISAVPGSSITAYDPDSRGERLLLIRALERLEQFGVLRRRTHDEQLLRSWEEARQGVGRGYSVDRSALLQLVDPATVAATSTCSRPPRSTATTRCRRLSARPSWPPRRRTRASRTARCPPARAGRPPARSPSRPCCPRSPAP